MLFKDVELTVPTNTISTQSLSALLWWPCNAGLIRSCHSPLATARNVYEAVLLKRADGLVLGIHRYIRMRVQLTICIYMPLVVSLDRQQSTHVTSILPTCSNLWATGDASNTAKCHEGAHVMAFVGCASGGGWHCYGDPV